MLFTVLQRASVILLLISASVFAQQPIVIPSPPSVAATAYLLMDSDTGYVIAEKNADERLPPASLTKMMTSYIVSSEIEKGAIKPTDMVNISVKAWKMKGSSMYIREGTQVSVKDLLRGVIIQSGNDASVALAEHIAGSEEGFVQIMNQQAVLLGMKDTHFANSTGWPADEHYTTARDLAKLAQALINDYPEHYKLYSEKYFKYNDIDQPNRNTLLFTDSSVDGVKTGQTEEAGFCLVASSKRDDVRLISVVMGTKTNAARASESQKLLGYGFRYFDTHKIYDENQLVSVVDVWKGKQESVPLIVTKPVLVTFPKGSEDKIQLKVDVNPYIEAPFEQGTPLGKLSMMLDGKVLKEVPLVSKIAATEAGFFGTLFDSTGLFLNQLF